MFTILPQYQTVANFAARYVRTKGKNKGKLGVARQFIYELIDREKKEANSTDIDVMEVDGVVFVKYKGRGEHCA